MDANVIKASDARKRAEENSAGSAVQNRFDFWQKIENAVKNGEFSIESNHYVYSLPEGISLSELEDFGYEVEFCNDDYGDYYIVSWKNAC